MNKATGNFLLADVLVFVIFSCQPIFAQDSEDYSDEKSEIEEIIVTATKRDTSLQDTAMSISVVTGAELANRGITSVNEFLTTIPGVSMAEVAPGLPRLAMRGIATDSVYLGNATTSVYLDDIPVGLRSRDIRLIDIERVEVLKGPQGTLYGQSALGGVIRYITNQPNTEALTGGIDSYLSNTEYSSGINYGLNGYVNIPISDTLAVRAVAYYYDNDGFIDVKGESPKDDANTEETIGGRLALKWNVTDSVVVDLVYLNQRIDLGSALKVSETFALTPGLPVNLQPIDLSEPISQELEEFLIKDEILNLTLGVSFDAFDLTILASKKKLVGGLTMGRRLTDQGGYLLPYEALQRGANAPQIFAPKDDIVSFEARLVSNDDSDDFFNWLVGVWYDKIESEVINHIVHAGPDALTFGIPVTAGFLYLDQFTDDLREELAFYGEVAMHLTDKATLTLGYRRSDVVVDNDLIRADGAFDDRSLLGVDQKVQEDVNTYKVNLEYALNDDVLLYGQASSGYRAGGYNGADPLAGLLPSSYGSDTLWNYELGAKTTWLDGRLIANATLYRVDWDDIQLRTEKFGSNNVLTSIIANSGKAKVDGVELEIDYRILEPLTLGVNYALTDATLEEDAVAAGGFAGDQLPGVAKITYALFVDYARPLTGEMDMGIRLTHRYIDSRLSALGSGDLVAISGFEFPSYTNTDLRIGVSHTNGLEVALFGNNIFNNIGVGWIENVPTHIRQRITQPRIVGLNVGFRF